jgi:hypothetical protein
MKWAVGDLAVCIRAYESIPVGTVLRVSYVGKNTLGFERQIGVVTRGLYSQSRFKPAPTGTPPPEPEKELELPFGYGTWLRVDPCVWVWSRESVLTGVSADVYARLAAKWGAQFKL